MELIMLKIYKHNVPKTKRLPVVNAARKSFKKLTSRNESPINKQTHRLKLLWDKKETIQMQ